MNTNETDKDKARQETCNLVPAPAVKLMKSRVLSRPGENSDRLPGLDYDSHGFSSLVLLVLISGILILVHVFFI